MGSSRKQNRLRAIHKKTVASQSGLPVRKCCAWGWPLALIEGLPYWSSRHYNNRNANPGMSQVKEEILTVDIIDVVFVAV